MTREELLLKEVQNKHSLSMWGLEDWNELPLTYKDQISEEVTNEYANRRVQEYQKWFNMDHAHNNNLSESKLLETFNQFMEETV